MSLLGGLACWSMDVRGHPRVFRGRQRASTGSSGVYEYLSASTSVPPLASTGAHWRPSVIRGHPWVFQRRRLASMYHGSPVSLLFASMTV